MNGHEKAAARKRRGSMRDKAPSRGSRAETIRETSRLSPTSPMALGCHSYACPGGTLMIANLKDNRDRCASRRSHWDEGIDLHYAFHQSGSITIVINLSRTALDKN